MRKIEDLEVAAMSMGYRYAEKSKFLLKPVGWSVFVIDTESDKISCCFKAANGTMAVWSSEPIYLDEQYPNPTVEQLKESIQVFELYNTYCSSTPADFSFITTKEIIENEFSKE